MPKIRTTKKSKYRSVSIPEDLVEIAEILIVGYYRTVGEALIEFIRRELFKLAKTQQLINKLKKSKKIKKSSDTIN